jgi:hypothetical protein
MDLTISPLTAGRWSALEDLSARRASNGAGTCTGALVALPPQPRADNGPDLWQLAASGQPPAAGARQHGGVAPSHR